MLPGPLTWVLDEILGGRWGQTPRALLMAVMRLRAEPRAALLARNGHLGAALGVLAKSHRLGPLGERVKGRCVEAMTFLQTPLPPVSESIAGGSLCPFNRRVLFALHSSGNYDPSGYAARSNALITALRQRAIDVHAATRLGYPWDLHRHREKPVVDSSAQQAIEFTHRADPTGGISLGDNRYIERYADYLVKLANRHQVGAIHAASNYLDGSAAALAARMAGVPSIYEVRGLWHLTRTVAEPDYADSDHYRYCERREIAACRSVDRVLAISAPLRDWLIDRGVPGDRIDVLGNAAATVPHDQRNERTQARNAFAVGPQTTVIGYAGAFAAYEGLDLLLRSVAKLPPARDVRLLLAGSGVEERKLRAIIEQLGLHSRVTLCGRLPAARMGEFHAACDAIVLPRIDHPLTRLVPAIKPFEALAWGRPVFVSAALGAALQGSLEGVQMLSEPLDDCVGQILSRLPELPACAGSVPSWDDRARQLDTLYQELCSGER